MSDRQCSQPGCGRRAVSSLSVDYPGRILRLGPLGDEPVKGVPDLCLDHTRSMTPPRGWSLTRLSMVPELRPRSGSPAMALLADEVRRIGFGESLPPEEIAGRLVSDTSTAAELARRSHLRLLPDVELTG